MNFLQTNIVAIIALIATIIVPLIIHLLEKNKKELSYQIISASKIFNTKVDKRLKISFNNTEVTDDLSLVLLKIKNTGNQPIYKKDFEENSHLTIKVGGNILSVESQNEAPPELNIKTEHSTSKKIYITPLLLNPKDEFTLKMLVQSYTNNLNLGTRIAGITQVQPLKEKLSFTNVIIYCSIFAFLSILSIFIDFSSPIQSSIFISFILGIILEMIITITKYITKKIKKGS